MEMFHSRSIWYSYELFYLVVYHEFSHDDHEIDFSNCPTFSCMACIITTLSLRCTLS